MIADDLAAQLAEAAAEGERQRSLRDTLIVEALAAGATQREVAQVVGLTQPAVSAIARRAKERSG